MNRKISLSLALVSIAAVPRILGAFFLPNTFGDAYVYIRDIGNLSTKIKSGAFALTDLYGFWLPFYQFISAIINTVVGNGFYVGKIVSAAFGVGVCLLVYAITLQLVENGRAAILAFLLIALNPLHILTSTSALTDVPHAFFVLACLYFILRRRWIAAAVLAALAGFTRVESWMLIGLIPAIQFWKERRVSIPAVVITLIPPLFWFWISWKATGDWLACFKARQQYHDWLLTQNPALNHFTFTGVLKDGAMFLSGADVAVLIAAFVAGWLVIRRFMKREPVKHDGDSIDSSREPIASAETDSILPLLVFFFPFLALLIVVYATHQQPIIFPRYGLILFSLGIPILAWTYFAIVRRHAQRSRTLLRAIVLLCVLDASAQFVGGVGELNRYRAQRRVADYLRDNFDVKSNAKIFCDEGTVRVLSGIPEDRFVMSSDLPRDFEGFWSGLRERKVEWLVIAPLPGAIPARFIALSENSGRIGPYQFEQREESSFLRTEIQLYRRVH